MNLSTVVSELNQCGRYKLIEFKRTVILMTLHFRDFLLYELCLRKLNCMPFCIIFFFQPLYNIIMYHLLLHVTCSPSPLLVSILQKIMRSFRHDILVYNTFNNRADSTRSTFFFTYTFYGIRIQTGDKNWRDDCQNL